jgi:hypothetical protein
MGSTDMGILSDGNTPGPRPKSSCMRVARVVVKLVVGVAAAESRQDRSNSGCLCMFMFMLFQVR